MHPFKLFLRITLIGISMSAWFEGGATQAAGSRNVVLVVTDDQGLVAGCYGDRVVQTPHLDALAKTGTRFDQAFCTTSSCSASRSVILTGLFNHANGQYGLMHANHNQHTFGWVEGLPVLLARAGYRTCSIGKFHVQPEENYHFEQYLNEQTSGSRNSVQMAELARQFIVEKDSRPFFLYFCPSDPHRAAQGFANERTYPGINAVEYDPQAIKPPDFLPSQPEVREELAEYYTSISRADQGLGRLVEVLRETGNWDNTLIIFMSDNGMPFPGAKTTLYEPGIRLPLVVRSPDQQRSGVASHAMVCWADITPTILEFTKAAGPKYPLQGRSFLSVLDQDPPEGWGEVYGSHTFHEITMYYPMRMIRTRRHKLIMNVAYPLEYPFASDLWNSPTWQAVLERGDSTYGRRTLEAFVHRPQYELYDLESDPQETVNLAGDSEHAELLASLKAKLRKWQEETKDPWAIKYRHE